MRTTKRMLAAGLMAAALLVAPVGLGAAATAPAYAEPVKPAKTITGHPLTGEPGTATGQECRGYAGAVNGLNDRGAAGDKEMADSILSAGQARGCVFMH